MYNIQGPFGITSPVSGSFFPQAEAAAAAVKPLKVLGIQQAEANLNRHDCVMD